MGTILNKEFKVTQSTLYTNICELIQVHRGLLELSRWLKTKREEIKEVKNMFIEIKQWETRY
jgi:hypothetical protein